MLKLHDFCNRAMSVNPGFGGQPFIDSQLRKIDIIRGKLERTGRQIDLEVDGGIDPSTAPRVIAAGADVVVAGTAVFKGGPADYAKNIEALRQQGAKTIERLSN